MSLTCSSAKLPTAGAITLATADDVERTATKRTVRPAHGSRYETAEQRHPYHQSDDALRTAYPLETAEIDDSIAAADYRALHQRVADYDLPRVEQEFKDYLNQNTIRDIANLSAQLNKQESMIRERVESINRSLHDIDYNDGRFIKLVPDRTPNIEIREFRSRTSLPARATSSVEQTSSTPRRGSCRSGGSSSASKVVKAPSTKTAPGRRPKVTDVRQWFVFSASERWRADDTEYENYTDSAGKSGGQKEKLAYTILAASLAYQFKLDKEATRTKSFRFVVIDEAFGRGSD